jgi:hypothetical protein
MRLAHRRALSHLVCVCGAGRLLAPFLQSYVGSGGFTFLQRCWDSIKENVILYAALGVVGAGALIYIGVAYQMSMCVRVLGRVSPMVGGERRGPVRGLGHLA